MRTFLLVLAAYAIGLAYYAVPFVGDQKTYLATAMEMWERGSFLHPYLMGETSYFKPPWLFWATLAGWKLFGFGLFGAFFPSAVATAATATLVDSISRRVDWRRTDARGWAPSAGLWLAGCAGTVTYGTTAQMEIWIVFFYALGWWCFLNHHESGRWRWLAAGLVVSGLSALNKSPLYSVFSVLGYWLYLAFAPGGAGPRPGQGARRWFLRPDFYLAHLLGVAVGLSWYAAIWHTDRDRFWSQYVLQETLGKCGGNGSSVVRMWADFATFCVPFLLLLVPAFARAAELGRKRLAFLAAWAVIPAAFFSYFPYRTETYLYILVPALAIWLDWTWRGAGPAKWVARLNGALLCGLLLAVAAFVGLAGFVAWPWAVGLGLSGLVFLVTSWNSLGNAGRGLASAALGVIFAFRLCAVSMGERDLEGLRDAVAAQSGRKLAFLDEGRNIWHEVGLLSAAVGRPSQRLYSREEALRAARGGAMLVLDAAQAKAFQPALEKGKARVRTASWLRWQRSFAVPSLKDLRELGSKEKRRALTLVWLD
ncbi:MAG: glycosyltransferase family 39 protein [Oligoflexia bacterium]|nr:glycosyltransferase family 39 protein [Oligoflexia bacterium]